jgi:predicted small secreted protein
MISCPKCGRHHKLEETACPFCRRKSSAKSVIGLAMTTVLTPVVLAACYGMGGAWKDCDDTGNASDPYCSDTGIGPVASDDTGSSGASDDTGSSGDSDDTGSSGDTGGSADTGSPVEEDISTAESKVPMDIEFPECATDDDLAAR